MLAARRSNSARNRDISQRRRLSWSMLILSTSSIWPAKGDFKSVKTGYVGLKKQMALFLNVKLDKANFTIEKLLKLGLHKVKWNRK
jgi:hypothetical protein